MVKNGRPTRAESSLIDWTAIKARACSGEALRQIAVDFNITHSAISQRAKKERWFEEPETNPDLSEARWLERVKNTELAARWDPSHPDQFRTDIAAAFLADLSKGTSVAAASDLHGITKQELRSWRVRDKTFDSLVRAAIAQCRKSLIEKIAKAGDVDWKANAWLLERLPDHREEFAQAEHARGGGGIVVNINVSRDEQVAIEGGVKMIDVTPEKP